MIQYASRSGSVAWDLYYARNNVMPDGSRRVVCATNRRVNFREAANNARSMDYQFTVIDPNTFTGPWLGEFSWYRTDQPMFEHACHEGNYSLPNILAGARHAEAEAKPAPPASAVPAAAEPAESTLMQLSLELCELARQRADLTGYRSTVLTFLRPHLPFDVAVFHEFSPRISLSRATLYGGAGNDRLDAGGRRSRAGKHSPTLTPDAEDLGQRRHRGQQLQRHRHAQSAATIGELCRGQVLELQHLFNAQRSEEGEPSTTAVSST